MARWSSAGADWGNNEKVYATRSIVAAGVIVLVVGVLAGYLIRGASHQGTNLKASVFANSAVIDPTLQGMLAAPKTPDGSVRAVTSFITGFPGLSLKTPQEESTTLDQIVAPNADPNLRTDLKNATDKARNSLIGGGSFQKPLTAKLIMSPASYKVEMLADDRARVRVWFNTIYIDSSTQKSLSTWATNDIQVQYTDHWRLTSYAGVGGPTPQPQSDDSKPSSYAEVAGVFNGFTAYRYATAAPKE